MEKNSDTADERIVRGLEWLDGERIELEEVLKEFEGKKELTDVDLFKSTFEKAYYYGARHLFHTMLDGDHDVEYDKDSGRHRVV